MHLLQKWWRYAFKSLLEGITVTDTDLMLDGTSKAKLISLQCKNIMKD